MQNASTQMIVKLNAAIRRFLTLHEFDAMRAVPQESYKNCFVDMWFALADGEHFLADLAKPVREAPARSPVSLADLVEAVAAQEGVTIMIAAGGPPPGARG